MLHAQAESGFPGVGEESLEALLTSKGKALPADAAAADHRKTDLVLAAISAIKPDLTDKEASECVCRGFLQELPDAYADLYVPPDMLGEVLVPGEAQAVEKYAVQVAAVHAEREHIVATRDKRVHKYFKKAPAPAYSQTQKKRPALVAREGRQEHRADHEVDAEVGPSGWVR